MKSAGDERSQKLFKKALEHIGHKVKECDKTIKKGVKRADLTSEKDGVQYLFELKQRYFPSDKYDTMVITDDKNWIVSPNAFWVFFYTDGKGCIIRSSETPCKIDTKYASETTRFKNRKKVLKTFYHYSPEQAQWFDFDASKIY